MVSALALTGCSETREFFGLTNRPPDEFLVVDHPSLAIPPDFGLKPPRPGVASAAGDNPSEKAAKALYGDSKMELVPEKGVSKLNVQGLAPSEQVVIMQSGSDKADPNIRSVIDREASKEVVANRKLIDQLLFWKDEKKENGAVVNASAERARIEALKQQGAPINVDGTPAVDAGKKIVVQ